MAPKMACDSNIASASVLHNAAPQSGRNCVVVALLTSFLHRCIRRKFPEPTRQLAEEAEYYVMAGGVDERGVEIA